MFPIIHQVERWRGKVTIVVLVVKLCPHECFLAFGHWNVGVAVGLAGWEVPEGVERLRNYVWNLHGLAGRDKAFISDPCYIVRVFVGPR